MVRKRIGELLVERGVLTRAQLEAGLAAQGQSRKRLGVTLLELGLLSEVHLAQALADSLQLATVDLTQLPVDWSAVHLLRAAFCEAHGLFPFAVEGRGTPSRRLMVALSDPLDGPALQEIAFTTGLEVAPFVSTLSQIRTAIFRYYHKAPGAPEEEPPTVVGEELPLKAPPTQSRSEVARDLDFLFGRGEEDEPAEKLERKFWALMRILARKGLVTREEFLKELEDSEP
jgi:hypothetical protein